MWARSHHAHVPLQHIPELRHLVDVRLSHYVAPFRLSRVVFRCLQFVGISVHLHAAEFVAVELLAVQSVSFLLEENRSRHCQFRYYCHDNENDREQRHQEHSRHHDVEGTFQCTVFGAGERFPVETQVWHVAEHVEINPVVQVVRHVRYVVEVYEILFAVVYYRQDLVGTA